MTTTEPDAFQAMLAHHQVLGDEVARRAGGCAQASSKGPYRARSG